MRTRELILKPMSGEKHGEARVYRVPGAGPIAVVRGPRAAVKEDAVAAGLRAGGFEGGFVVMEPGTELTIFEVEDGAPARWKEDVRPSYEDLRLRVAQLEARAASGADADCAPYLAILHG